MTSVLEKVDIQEYIEHSWTEDERAQHREAFKRYLQTATERAGVNRLRQEDEDTDYQYGGVSYCALGLAGKMMGLYDDDGFKVYIDVTDEDRRDELCYQAIRNWLGFEVPLGQFPDGVVEGVGYFATAFDKHGNFRDMADLVDKVKLENAFSWRNRMGR